MGVGIPRCGEMRMEMEERGGEEEASECSGLVYEGRHSQNAWRIVSFLRSGKNPDRLDV